MGSTIAGSPVDDAELRRDGLDVRSLIAELEIVPASPPTRGTRPELTDTVEA